MPLCTSLGSPLARGRFAGSHVPVDPRPGPCIAATGRRGGSYSRLRILANSTSLNRPSLRAPLERAAGFDLGRSIGATARARQRAASRVALNVPGSDETVSLGPRSRPETNPDYQWRRSNKGILIMWAIILNSVYRQFLRSSLSGMRKFAAG